MALATAARERVRSDIVRLVHRGLDVHDFSRAVTRMLERAVPFDGTCLLTFDPATLLPTDEVVENGPPAEVMFRLSEIEMCERDSTSSPQSGTGSRGDLVARLFFDHYVPRLTATPNAS